MPDPKTEITYMVYVKVGQGVEIEDFRELVRSTSLPCDVVDKNYPPTDTLLYELADMYDALYLVSMAEERGKGCSVTLRTEIDMYSSTATANTAPIKNFYKHILAKPEAVEPKPGQDNYYLGYAIAQPEYYHDIDSLVGYFLAHDIGVNVEYECKPKVKRLKTKKMSYAEAEKLNQDLIFNGLPAMAICKDLRDALSEMPKKPKVKYRVTCRIARSLYKSIEADMVDCGIPLMGAKMYDEDTDEIFTIVKGKKGRNTAHIIMLLRGGHDFVITEEGA